MNEHKKQKRQFLVILLIVFLGFLGISMPYLIFPALFLNPAYSILPASWGSTSHAIFLGITLAAYPLGQFIGSPILGALSDDYGRKKLLAGSLVLSGLFNLLSGFAIAWQNLELLIISRFLAGLMEGNIAIARAMGADLKLLSKHTTFGRINAVTSIAYLIGPLIGGLMTDKELFEGLSTSTPFYVICILFFALAGLSILVLEKKAASAPTQKRTVMQRINILKRMLVLFANKQLQFLIIASTTFTLAVDIFYEFAPVYLTIKWTLVPAQLIYYNGVLCIGLAIGNGWLPAYFTSMAAKKRGIMGSMGSFALCLLGVLFTDSVFFMLLLNVFAGIAIGIAATLITVKISDSVSDAIQGEVMGVQMSLRVLGDALICLFGGILLVLSPKLILFVAAALSAAVMGYYALKQKKY